MLEQQIQRLKWLHGYASFPKYIDLVLTDNCNLSCSYCPLHGKGEKNVQPVYMDTGKALNLID
jgi:molybdenum cofactor biosynthesis enzyme MoaA